MSQLSLAFCWSLKVILTVGHQQSWHTVWSCLPQKCTDQDMGNCMVHRYPALSGPCTHDKHHSLAVEGSPCLVQTRIPMDSLYWQVHGPDDLQTNTQVKRWYENLHSQHLGNASPRVHLWQFSQMTHWTISVPVSKTYVYFKEAKSFVKFVKIKDKIITETVM